MSLPLHLLLVEGDESDAGFLVRQLGEAGYEVDYRRVQDAGSMHAALADTSWDLVLYGYAMPDFDAPAALALLHESGCEVPFVVVSGTIDKNNAVDCVGAGASDYLMTDNLAHLASAVERELRHAAVRSEHRREIDDLREREARFALAIEATELGLVDYDPLTDKASYSPLARHYLGLPENGKTSLHDFFEHLHPEDRPGVENAAKEALAPRGNGHFAEEYRVNLPPGAEERWLSGWGRTFFNAAGEPVRFVGAIRDISSRKRGERDLQFQLHLTSCITEQSTDCILLIDRQGIVRFVNPLVERVFGFTAAELKGASVHEVLHHRYPDGCPYPAHECPFMQAVRTGGTLRDVEDVFVRKDGTPIDIALSCKPLEQNGAPAGTVFTLRDITERKQVEKALRRSDERFQRLFNANVVGIFITDGEHVLEANDSFLGMLGYTREEFVRDRLTRRDITPPEHEASTLKALESIRTAGVCPAFEREYIRKDGATIPVLVAAVELDREDRPNILCFVMDLTERRKLENQFRQAQKLESIGRLAAGVAHDFNNLLTVIMGYSRVAKIRADSGQPLGVALDQIFRAADRAAALTSQLLTFSRENISAPRNIPLNEVVLGVEKMLHSLIQADIELVLTTEPDTGSIHADPALVEQVIVNLAVNARDAMPNGGSLFIQTSRIDVDNDLSALTVGVRRGLYAALIVTDTGTGMTPEVKARLFEPFFTTKEPGKGSGLGLSTVYGIVQQSGGSISVHSTAGLGTSFRVLFPAADGSTAAAATERFAETPAGGSETILLLEDEPGVRKYVRGVLEDAGYRVLDVGTGPDAIQIARGYRGAVHLLLTDVALPDMNGNEVIREFNVVRPGVPALRMSGYPERLQRDAKTGLQYLQKPFTPEALLRRIREILDAAAGPRHNPAA